MSADISLHPTIRTLACAALSRARGAPHDDVYVAIARLFPATEERFDFEAPSDCLPDTILAMALVHAGTLRRGPRGTWGVFVEPLPDGGSKRRVRVHDGFGRVLELPEGAGNPTFAEITRFLYAAECKEAIGEAHTMPDVNAC